MEDILLKINNFVRFKSLMMRKMKNNTLALKVSTFVNILVTS